MNPLSYLEGPQRNPARFHQNTVFYTHGDFVNYVARLKQVPRQVKLQTKKLLIEQQLVISIDFTSNYPLWA